MKHEENKYSEKKREDNVTKRALRVYSAYNPKYFPVKFLQIIFNCVSPYFNLWMSSEIVTALYGGKGREKIYLLVLVTLLGNFLVQILGAVLRKAADTQLKLLESEEAAVFNKKVLSLDYDKLENPAVRKQRRKIRENSCINGYGMNYLRIRVEGLMEGFVNLFFCLLFFAEMFSLIAKGGVQWTGVLLFFVMIACMVWNIVINSKSNEKMSMCWKGVGELMLEENRLGSGFYTLGLDTRIYRQYALLDKVRKKINQTHLRVFTEANQKAFLCDIPADVMTRALELCAYLIVVFYCLLGVFPVGGVIKYVGYLGRLTDYFSSIFFCKNELKTNEAFLKDYLDFFDIKNDMYQGTLAVEKRSDKKFDIEFRNVSFRYEGTEEYALKDINIKLKVGERLAVVGMNGSGKTTFIKLLCRLYDPTEGEILMNDFNIRKYDYRQYLDIFSVVFQDYKLLAMPLGNNVASAESWDSVKAERILNEVGFGERYARMEKKLNTPLYKDFDRDGVNVSGGEAQKIALARALYRDAPFIILDEPTAALDPLAEAEIYSKFDEIVGDKTAIYISHRLSSCRFCDKIAVFDGGCIVQVGTHEELLADERGKYYELWNAQAQYYKCEKNF